MRIKTILFDLDNTLLDFNKAESIALAKTLTELGIEPTDAIIRRYSEINLAQWKLLEQGKITRAEVKRRRYQLLFEELGVAYEPDRANAIYEEQLAIGHFFIEGAPELLKNLYQQYDLYLVTNGTARVQHGRLQSAGIEKYLKGIFISEEIGCDKPSRTYFDKCFAQIPAFCREETILVGDSLSSDIQGGKNAGIRTVWFHSPEIQNHTQIIPDYEIHKLSELQTLLLSLEKEQI